MSQTYHINLAFDVVNCCLLVLFLFAWVSWKVARYGSSIGLGRNDHWLWRFYRDDSAWVRDPKVFMDRGRSMPDGPPLLKERRYLRKDAAEQMWKSLQTQGWKKTRPLWGATTEPWSTSVVFRCFALKLKYASKYLNVFASGCHLSGTSSTLWRQVDLPKSLLCVLTLDCRSQGIYMWWDEDLCWCEWFQEALIALWFFF